MSKEIFFSKEFIKFLNKNKIDILYKSTGNNDIVFNNIKIECTKDSKTELYMYIYLFLRNKIEIFLPDVDFSYKKFNSLKKMEEFIMKNFKDLKAKKLFPNKKFENGKTTYFDEKEVSEIIKNIDYDNSQAKQPLLEGKGQTKTTLMLKEEAQNSLDNLKQLSIQDQIKASLSLQQNIIEQLNEKNIVLTNENTELKKENLITGTGQVWLLNKLKNE